MAGVLNQLVASTGLAETAWTAADAAMRLTRSRAAQVGLAAMQVAVVAAVIHHSEALAASPLVGVASAVAVGAAALCPSVFLIGLACALFLAFCVVVNCVAAVVLVLFVAGITAFKLLSIVYSLVRLDVIGARRALGTLAWWQSLDLLNAGACLARDAVEQFDPATGVKMRDARTSVVGVGSAPPPAPAPSSTVRSRQVAAPPPVPALETE